MQKRHWTDLILAVESFLAFAYGWVYFPIAQGHKGDFVAILSHRDQPSPYWDGEGLGYGPVFALYDLALRPFHDLPAMRLMYLFNMVLLAVMAVALVKTFLPAPRERRETLVAIFLIVNFYPLIHLLRQNNVEITEVVLLALAYWCLARGREAGAGVCYGLAVATKIVPIVLLPHLIWRRRWRAAIVMVATIVVAYLSVAAIKGSSPFALYITERDWPAAYNNNQALSGYIWRFFSQKDFATADSLSYPRLLFPVLARQTTNVAVLILVGAVALMMLRRCGWWPRPASDVTVELIEQQLVLLVTLLALPHSHVHYFALALPLYLVGLRVLRDGQLPASAITLLAVSYVLLGLLLFLRLLDPVVLRRFPVSALEIAKLYSVPFAGALLAVFALAQAHRARLAAAR